MPIEEFAIRICRHIKTNGLRCQSPALTSDPFCYFHARLHKDHPAPLTARQIAHLIYDDEAQLTIRNCGEDPMQIARAYPRQNEFNFPALEDADSIQLAASMLFHAVAQGQVHLRRARLLRDLLRVANTSIIRATPATQHDAHNTPVREYERTAEGVAIAAGPISHSPEAPATTPASASPEAPQEASPQNQHESAPEAPPASSPQPAQEFPVAPHPIEHAPQRPNYPQVLTAEDFAPNPSAMRILPERPPLTLMQ